MKFYKLGLFSFSLFFLTTLFGQTKKQKHFGFSFGVGLNSFKIENNNWSQPPTNYNDSLNSIESKSTTSINLGISYYLNLTEKISLRPIVILTIPETGKLVFNKKSGTEILDFKSVAEAISIPFIYKITTKSFKPYLTIGPSFLFNLGQDENTKSKIEFKVFDVLGQIGIGGEIPLKYFKIKPELQFSAGLLEMRNIKTNLYNNTISKLQRQNINLTFYFCNLLDLNYR